MLARSAWRGAAGAFLAAAVGVGCGADVPTDSDSDAEEEPRRISMVVAPTYSTVLAPTTSRTGIGPIALGTYSEPTLVEIKATGFIDRYWGYVWYYGTKQGQFDQQIDAAGLNCTQRVHIAFSLTAGGWFCDSQGLPLDEDWTTLRVIQGSGTAEWVRPGTGGQCDSPGTPDCFSYSGSFEVTVTPFPADLALKASHPIVTPGQNVTFTASVTPDSIEHTAVPFRIAEWRWVPDAGGTGTVLTQCTNQKVCNYAPTVSGMMRATGFANGAATEATAQVTVFPCLTGDSLLDNPNIRSGLRSAFDSSGYPGVPPADRIERGGGAFLTPEGDTVYVPMFPPGPQDDACSFWPADHAGQFPGSIIVIWHTHPFEEGDELPSPDYCYRDPRLPPLQPGDVRRAGARPSRNDINEGGWLDHLIVTPSLVWVRRKYSPAPPPTTLAPPFDRNGTCNPLAPPIL